MTPLTKRLSEIKSKMEASLDDIAFLLQAVEEMQEAIRATLGHYALFENEEGKNMPKYIVKCERALTKLQAMAEE